MATQHADQSAAPTAWWRHRFRVPHAAPRPMVGTAIVVTALTLAGCSSAENVGASDATDPGASEAARSAVDDTAGAAPSAEATEPEAATEPAARMYFTMVGDPDTGRVFVFGGQSFHSWTRDLTDAWAFTPATGQWEQIDAPDAGDLTAAAYDRESQVIVATTNANETWSFDPATGGWERMAPAEVPGTRCGHTLTYDSGSDRVVAFGGFACSSTADPLMDATWSYDHNSDTWKRMAPATSPPARIFHNAAYDASVDRVVLWGGRVDDDRVWTYDVDADEWTAHTAEGGPPAVHAYHAMAYDPVQERVLVHSGAALRQAMSNAGELLDGLWAYDTESTTWTQLDPSEGPEARMLSQMVFDPGTGTHVLFGGEVKHPYSNLVSNETWVFDPQDDTWRLAD